MDKDTGKRETNWHIYAIVLAITLFIFGSAYLLSDFFYQQRMSDVRAVEQSLNLNVLATEVDYSLLADAICEGESSVLSEELSSLAEKLSYMEETGENKESLESLKKNYTLLQVKDYLLSKEKAVKCGVRPPTILYFYSNEGNCADCKRQGYVLTGLQQDYPGLRIYAFDYNLDLSVIRTLRSIYKLSGELPALVIDRVPYYGFKDKEAVITILPSILTSSTTLSTSSTTKR
jgi:hypothetical protein